jgi:hypothetical protein
VRNDGAARSCWQPSCPWGCPPWLVTSIRRQCSGISGLTSGISSSRDRVWEKHALGERLARARRRRGRAKRADATKPRRGDGAGFRRPALPQSRLKPGYRGLVTEPWPRHEHLVNLAGSVPRGGDRHPGRTRTLLRGRRRGDGLGDRRRLQGGHEPKHPSSGQLSGGATETG